MPGRVDIEVVVRWVVENGTDLPPIGTDATPDRTLLPVETLVVEEIDPMPTVLITRGVVKMKGVYVAIEPAPREDVTHSLVFQVEVEMSEAYSVAISTVTELVTGQVYGESTIAMFARLRRRRGRPGEHEHRRDERQADSDSSHCPGTFVLHRWDLPCRCLPPSLPFSKRGDRCDDCIDCLAPTDGSIAQLCCNVDKLSWSSPLALRMRIIGNSVKNLHLISDGGVTVDNWLRSVTAVNLPSGLAGRGS